MGTRFARLTRYAAAGISAVMLLAAAACGSQPSAAPGSGDSSTDIDKQATGPITVVSSINQWGSLAAELGGDDVKVTSIVNSTNVDAHDFEPKTSDVAKLSKAQVVVANGAGYDSWATKSLGQGSNLVSAASVVGATDGDNPHLWFSKDARTGMAEAITEAYIKALPSKKKDFEQRLATWKQGEQSLEQWVDDFTKHHTKKVAYAATEPVAYYLMSDLGFEDITPKGYTQSTASGGEVAPADLQSFQKLLEDGKADVLVNNTQESSDATNMITGTAGRADVPVVDISEQMPEDVNALNDWINQLVNTIIDAVDPSYGCESDTENGSGDGGSSEDASSSDSGSANTTESDSNGTSSSDDSNGSAASADGESSNDSGDDAPTYLRECKASSDAAGGSGISKDGANSADASADDAQPDPNKQ
ncbi:ABC transporter substrate-binding protein [Bifidobacterium reuteri]|uniref:ABC-type metal ion transport system, periplasmic component/surface adhesin n=2 Tax=Bifidobacterium reuteri TaxID=983706 RepID=A0A087CRK4_9BIFI|nr:MULTISPECIES: zinc ABC transporter substrate-binding protein [Bifidobacterium]KAA8826463.1 ABC transporter substrate-binding protein [Bifidobacterium reuteri]KFI85904.1 ABC-type metal ion transport system, periplasmic component/surface adhesin [Bifidobacterium reuteri DSM 23975]TPF79044.1 ABC transporter substrate-binding protein [Bifidobacterium sp. UTCIF-1]TPF80915.1 ABC transporter substrate-binding protein [Bifidobacterium sp. UTCIF-24]TPF83287.1 ABC transporter substrate-binding protei